jgi:hypothetical protein
MVMTYAFQTSVTCTAGSFASQVFVGNGLYDPDSTGVGAQPLGFDQWMAIYTRYRVIASAIRVNFATPDITTNDQGVITVAVTPNVIVSNFTNIGAATAQPYSKMKLQNGLSGGLGQLGPLTSMMETDLIMGVTKNAVLADDTLAGSNTSNPTNPWHWHCNVVPVDLGATTTVQLIGVIHFLVDFYDRNLLSLSETKAVKRKSLPSSGRK